tara:strand:+ start:709 stop:1404 length:696 start_codon:yes stop_codon:yes gene_type:complete
MTLDNCTDRLRHCRTLHGGHIQADGYTLVVHRTLDTSATPYDPETGRGSRHHVLADCPMNHDYSSEPWECGVCDDTGVIPLADAADGRYQKDGQVASPLETFFLATRTAWGATGIIPYGQWRDGRERTHWCPRCWAEAGPLDIQPWVDSRKAGCSLCDGHGRIAPCPSVHLDARGWRKEETYCDSENPGAWVTGDSRRALWAWTPDRRQVYGDEMMRYLFEAESWFRKGAV